MGAPIKKKIPFPHPSVQRGMIPSFIKYTTPFFITLPLFGNHSLLWESDLTYN